MGEPKLVSNLSLCSLWQINLDLPTVEDLVNHAIRTNDVVTFILQVKELFRKQRNLMMEVKQLQAK